MALFNPTSIIDYDTGYVVAEIAGTQNWSSATSWSSMTWAPGYTNPMIWYSEPVDLGRPKYFNLTTDTKANGKISYQVITSNTSSFATIYDRPQLDVVSYGSITTSTSTFKYGTASISLPGTTSSYATVTDSQFATGTGDFTIEFWMYALDNTKDFQMIVSNDTSSTQLNSVAYGVGYIKTSLRANGMAVGPLTTSTWHHVAVSYDSATNVERVFINGVCSGYDDQANTGTNTTNTVLDIGKGKGYITSNYSGGATIENPFNGYLDDLRFSNTCRYKGNLFDTVFTPPTTTLVNDTSTVLLITAERGVVDTPNILELTTTTIVEEGDENIPAFYGQYVMLGIQVESVDRGTIYSSKFTPNNKRLDLLLDNLDATALADATTTSNTVKVIDLERNVSQVLAVFPQKSDGLTDAGIIPVVVDKETPTIAFIKATEGSQDYVYGGSGSVEVDPATLNDPTIDVMVHVLPEQYMANGRIQTR